MNWKVITVKYLGAVIVKLFKIIKTNYTQIQDSERLKPNHCLLSGLAQKLR